LREVQNLREYRAAPLRVNADDFVSREVRAELNALPGTADVRERTVPMHYEVEDGPNGPFGVVRLVMPEKVARGLVAEELPELDRPVRFTVVRGARGSVKAESVEEIAEALDRPFTDSEISREREAPRRDGRGGGRDFIARGQQRDGGRDGERGRDDRRGPGGAGGGGKGPNRPGSPAGRGKRRGKY
jgi:ATP-dependent helicase HrpA